MDGFAFFIFFIVPYSIIRKYFLYRTTGRNVLERYKSSLKRKLSSSLISDRYGRSKRAEEKHFPTFFTFSFGHWRALVIF